MGTTATVGNPTGDHRPMTPIESNVSKAIQALEAYDWKRKNLNAREMKEAGEGENDQFGLSVRELVVILDALGYKPA